MCLLLLELSFLDDSLFFGAFAIALHDQALQAILILLFVTAVVSTFLGETANAAIIGVILLASVGLGFANEYRAERTADALHDRIRHTVVALRDGTPTVVPDWDVVQRA